MVIGILQGSVKLQWNIIKENVSDTLNTADLILVRKTAVKLYILGPTTNLITAEGKKTFGDRISVNITDGGVCSLTLQNLVYSDVGFFQLLVIIRRGDALSNVRRRGIQLIVQGMQLITICESCF